MRIFKCGCETEGVVAIRVDDDLYDCGGSPFIELGYWQYGHEDGHNWKYKLRAIWHIIKHGTPWVDMVILRSNVAKELGEYLIDIVKKGNKK
ncbi:MAG TPA: hypothetical protein ENH82_16730 [bacterium]|nr:hypothetical protein [bacterium]